MPHYYWQFGVLIHDNSHTFSLCWRFSSAKPFCFGLLLAYLWNGLNFFWVHFNLNLYTVLLFCFIALKRALKTIFYRTEILEKFLRSNGSILFIWHEPNSKPCWFLMAIYWGILVHYSRNPLVCRPPPHLNWSFFLVYEQYSKHIHE